MIKTTSKVELNMDKYILNALLILLHVYRIELLGAFTKNNYTS